MPLRKGQRTAATFVKGKSGNPLGRKVVTLQQREFWDLTKQHSREALSRMLQIMRQKKNSRLALEASIWLLEQAYGKAKIRIDATIKRELAELTHDDLVRIASGGRVVEAESSEGEPPFVH